MTSGAEYVGEASRFRDQDGRGEVEAIDERKVARWAANLQDARNADKLKYWTDYRLVSAELCVELDIGWSPQKRRYTLPVRDAAGRCVDVKLYRPSEKTWGKSLHYTEKAADGSAVGWGKPPRLWGLDRVAAATPGSGRAGVVLVCAGEPDAVVATSLGYLAVSPTSGEGSLCRAQDIAVLLGAGWPIRLMFDIDDAGRKAAGVWGRALAEFGFTNVKDVFLPFVEDGKDLSDWVRGDSWRAVGDYGDAGSALWAVVRATPKLSGDGAGGGNSGDEISADNPAGGTGGRAGRNEGGNGGDVSGAVGEGAGGGGGGTEEPEEVERGRRPVAELFVLALDGKLPEYGSRNRAGFWLWCQLRDERYLKGEALGFLERWVTAVNSRAGAKPGHPYTQDEARLSLEEAYSSAPRDANGKGLVYPLTDLGNAERFVARHGTDMFYTPAWDGWAAWNGRQWARAEAFSLVSSWAHSVPRMMYEEGQRLLRLAKRAGADEEEMKKAGKLASWARASESAGKLAAMVSLARSKCAVQAEVFDANGALLNCRNGTVEMRRDVSSGEAVAFRGHAREDMLTFCAPVDYDSAADCPQFMHFLKEVLPDEEVRDYVQRLVGYSLIGGNPSRVFIFAIGPTASGKSTLSNILQGVLGKYAQPFKLSLMRDKQDEGPRQDMVDLMPARIIFASEASEAWYLHADQVKYLVGNEPITARGVYGKAYITCYPAFTPWLMTNAVPQIKGADAALRRRLVAIPFEVTREADMEKESLAADIVSAEGAGVLRWALEGWARLQVPGCGIRDMPAVVAEATVALGEELTDFDQWLKECCDLGSEYSEFTTSLYESYRTWCMANHIPERDQISLRSFGKNLAGRPGFRKGTRSRPPGSDRTDSPLANWGGIRLKIRQQEPSE